MLPEEAEYRRLLGELAYVITPVVEAARSLIEKVLLEKGCRVRETPQP